MTRFGRALTGSLLFALAAQAGMAATPPAQIGYQGVLRSADGAPLGGTHDMVFRFTDAPAGGTLLLTDYHTGPNAIVVDGGLFTALLGGGTLSPGTESSLHDVFANHSPVYVEVQVGAETLAPRVQVVSTAYALNAGRLAGQMPAGFLDTGPSDQIKEGALTSNTSIIAQPAATTGDVRALKGITVSSAGVAVLGSALATSGVTEGVRGQSTSPDGRGVVGGAFATSGVGIGVLGESQCSDGTGVHGRATAVAGGTIGVGGEVFSSLGAGVAGVSHATSGEGWGVYGETASPEGYGVVSIGDSITAGDVYATGTKYFLTEHPGAADQAIRFACLEGDEIGVYQRGYGRLEAGEARVELPDPFPLVAAGRITVQVTPQEECGGLYVPPDQISAEGFTVRESGGFRSDAAFSYVVMAERTGFEDAEPVRSISISDKILTSSRLTSDQKATLRAALSSQSAESIGVDERATLYSRLHAGDFDESCRLLGGCRNLPAAPVEPDRRDLLPDRQTDREPTADTRSDSSIRAPQRVLQRATWADPPAEEAADCHMPPMRALLPTSLATPQVVSEAVETGDVVVLDRLNPGTLRPGSAIYDRGVVGVVAIVEGRVSAGDEAPVAVSGIVPCRVDADYGWIAPGDLLVASPTPGHAMRAADPPPGTILGKALESLEEGQGTIRILLTPR